MAKTKQQQVRVIYLTICLVVACLLMKVDSVNTVSIQSDENGNIFQQHQQHHLDRNVQEHNYFVDFINQEPNKIELKNAKLLKNDDYNNLEEVSLSNDVTKDQLVYGNPHERITIEKRGPGGFVGMRGKKFYYNDDERINENDNVYSLPLNQLEHDNGKDISWDAYDKPNVRRDRKASTTFYGVRGKKFTTMNGAYPSNDNHRWQEFLQRLEEERIRKTMLQDLLERLTDTNNDLQNEMTKRAPTGFTGVRGKRPVLDALDSSMESLTKRGFGNNAFVGVRGKKDVSHQTFKRSPSQTEALPGGSGKRQRFLDFSNKFVAVRGKKSLTNDMDPLNNKNNMSPLSAVSFLYGKRAPNGFLGMRGKRLFTTCDPLIEN